MTLHIHIYINTNIWINIMFERKDRLIEIDDVKIVLDYI